VFQRKRVEPPKWGKVTTPKQVAFISVALLGLVISGTTYAAERVFVPVPMQGQELHYDDGEPTILDGANDALLVVSIATRDKKTGWANIYVQNNGDRPFNFGESSVAATSGGLPLVVDAYADRIKAQKRQQMWAGVAAGITAASNNISASNAGYSRTQGSFRANTSVSAYGSGGYAQGYATTNGTFSGTTYNAADAQRAQNDANARNQAIFAQTRANADAARQDIQDRALKLNTLSPGQSVFGDVQFALPRRSKDAPTEFTLTVDLNGTSVQLLFREAE